jgi:hypothetical protein
MIGKNNYFQVCKFDVIVVTELHPACAGYSGNRTKTRTRPNCADRCIEEPHTASEQAARIVFNPNR